MPVGKVCGNTFYTCVSEGADTQPPAPAHLGHRGDRCGSEGVPGRGGGEALLKNPSRPFVLSHGIGSGAASARRASVERLMLGAVFDETKRSCPVKGKAETPTSCLPVPSEEYLTAIGSESSRSLGTSWSSPCARRPPRFRLAQPGLTSCRLFGQAPLRAALPRCPTARSWMQSVWPLSKRRLLARCVRRAPQVDSG